MLEHEILKSFVSISLDEMSGVKLMNRTDTKFVTTERKLRELLGMAVEDYFVQEIEGVREANYHTLYYDTKGNSMYLAHHNGKKTRQKLRIRSYMDSDLHFLEVKTKNNHGRTKKKRVTMETSSIGVSPMEDLIRYNDFLTERLWLNREDMLPKIENQFKRITLVNKNKTERLTIDCNLSFHNLETDTRLSLDDIVIVELKRDGLQPSPILSVLNRLRIRPMGFSKYCMGMAMTNPQLKQNMFKQRIKFICNKL